MTYYVYHIEELDSCKVVMIEPFEFDSFADAKLHCMFMGRLNSLDYTICDFETLKTIKLVV